VAIFHCLRFETSFSVASYYSQGHGGGIRPRLHTDMTCSSLHGSLYSLPVTMENVCCLSVDTETCLPKRCLSPDFRVCSLLRESVFGEPLASNGLPLWLHYSGFQTSCHSNKTRSVDLTSSREIKRNSTSQQIPSFMQLEKSLPSSQIPSLLANTDTSSLEAHSYFPKRYILIVYFHLRLGLPSGSSLQFSDEDLLCNTIFPMRATYSPISHPL
jgi:hypothetical protein